MFGALEADVLHFFKGPPVMTTFNKHRVIGMERLEDRRLMSGDIEIIQAADSNTLIVKEAAGQAGTAQAVLVSRQPSGMIRFTGLANADGSITKINNQTS